MHGSCNRKSALNVFRQPKQGTTDAPLSSYTQFRNKAAIRCAEFDGTSTSGAKRSLRLAVRPNFLTLAGPNSNFPMMGWTRVKVFNRLEGGVCTMCAPRDQRKSGDGQFKQVEVNELRHQRLADISGGHIKWSLLFKADVEP
jgi:hypothetical protein